MVMLLSYRDTRLGPCLLATTSAFEQSCLLRTRKLGLAYKPSASEQQACSLFTRKLAAS